MKNLVLFLIVCSISFHSLATTKKVISFNSAKKKLYSKVYNNAGKTIYCDCDWSAKKTDLNSCGLQSSFSKKHSKRAKRIEAEHIIPASWMYKVNKKTRQCHIDAKAKKQNPRKYCQKYDQEYKQAHNDLVNLYPAIGQINADRSNKPFLEHVSNKVKTYGQCDIKIGSRGIVPPTNKRGDIARIAFYMHETYGVTYSKRQLSLFNKWHKEDPISAQEKAHNNKIVKIQGFGIKQ